MIFKNSRKLLSSAGVLLGFTLVLSTSCERDEAPFSPGDVVGFETEMGTATDEQKHFFHAWLADCVNDVAYAWWRDKHADLLSLAQQRITRAINDPVLTPVYGKTELVWGPQLQDNAESSSGDEFTSSNLMYCLRQTSPTGLVTYNIGIAGTNMISSFDWMKEDFAVSQQVQWRSNSAISAGSYLGFAKLNELKDPVTNMTLRGFLAGELDANRYTVVNVCGHSLGGALTQVYSSYLREIFPVSTLDVHAWVYAGPSAGDARFANQLVAELQSYNAFENANDVVPHVWQKDKLNELCTIYNGDAICDSSIASTSTINGVIKALRLMSASGDYKSPGTPVVFTQAIPAYGSTTCDEMKAGLDGIWESGGTILESKLYTYVNHINQNCNPAQAMSWFEFSRLYYYMAQMGPEHTTAYLDYFVPDPNVRSVVAGYVPGGSAVFNIDQEKDVLEDFLWKIDSTLTVNNVTDCNCGS